ncbi:MAG: signal recognition particle-docking protein FtsY, partial [bacterium]
ADTFRAAATEQLEIWAKRAGVDVVRAQPGGDPAAVAYDALEAAIARNIDVLLVDTAGRLHTKVNLMEELKKIQRVLGKAMASAPHEILLVLDASTGQNALMQAKQFKEAVPLSGVVVTKLDGTAKGGMVMAVQSQLNLPIRFVGLGESIDDLKSFDSNTFVEALFQ